MFVRVGSTRSQSLRHELQDPDLPHMFPGWDLEDLDLLQGLPWDLDDLDHLYLALSNG